MGTWKSVAEIQIDQIILVAHQAVAHLPDVHRRDQVLLTLLAALHVLSRVDLHLDLPDRIQIDVVKIYQRVVVHLLDQVHQVEIAKDAMQMIRAEFVPPQWIAINQDCVREFLNQIFLKMLLAKNLRKQLAQSY